MADLPYIQNVLQGINITLSDCCTCSLHNASIEEMMGHFNKTCKTFTAVNAFKYQLQHYLFHDVNNATLDVVQKISSIITGLQAAARYLQEIAIIDQVLLPYWPHYHSTIMSFITGYNMCEVHS